MINPPKTGGCIHVSRFHASPYFASSLARTTWDVKRSKQQTAGRKGERLGNDSILTLKRDKKETPKI